MGLVLEIAPAVAFSPRWPHGAATSKACMGSPTREPESAGSSMQVGRCEVRPRRPLLPATTFPDVRSAPRLCDRPDSLDNSGRVLLRGPALCTLGAAPYPRGEPPITPTNSPGSSDNVLIGIPNAESSCPPGSTSSLMPWGTSSVTNLLWACGLNATRIGSSPVAWRWVSMASLIRSLIVMGAFYARSSNGCGAEPGRTPALSGRVLRGPAFSRLASP